MSDRNNFRVSVGGYHKHDVSTYIEQLKADAKTAEHKYQSLLSSVRQENTRLVSRIGELESRIGTLEQRLIAQQRRADEMEQQASTLMSDLSRCRTAFEQNRQRAKRLSHAFETSARENQSLRESLLHAEHENERLEQMRRRLAAILLEPDASGYNAPLSVVRGRMQQNEEDYPVGLGNNDLEEMHQDLDDLGESIANRLADIDGFIHATATIHSEPEGDQNDLTTDSHIYFHPNAVEDEGATQPKRENNAVHNIIREDVSELDIEEVRDAARKGFTPLSDRGDDNHQRQHMPSDVEKRWQRLGFVVRRGHDDAGYVEENRKSDPMFSSPIWSDDEAKQG